MSWHLAAKENTMCYGYILDSAMFESGENTIVLTSLYCTAKIFIKRVT